MISCIYGIGELNFPSSEKDGIGETINMKLSIPVALRNRRYFSLWLGLLISIAGSQMQISALFWHIRILTGEPQPLALGGIGLARILPIIIFSFLGGPVADTLNRRKVLFVTQTAMALVAMALAILTFTNHITIWYIYLLTAIQATAIAFDGPARQAMIPNIVQADELTSAFSISWTSNHFISRHQYICRCNGNIDCYERL
jgi:Na+/melibiose symporter-like transporter